MNLDYFVVGPRLALCSRSPEGVVPPYRLDFTILDPERGDVGWIETQLMEGHVRARLQFRPDAGDTGTAEAIRLAAGVLRKLSPVEIRVATGHLPSPQTDELMASGFRRETEHAFYFSPDEPGQPPPKTQSMEDLYADPYRVVWNFEPRQWQLLGPLLVELSRTPGAKILDIGCGFGKNAVFLEGLGFEVHGVDVAESAVSRCRKWVRHPDRFKAASVDRLPFGNDSFDAVLDVGCLHCLPRDMVERAVSEVARVTRPRGQLFSRVFTPRNEEWLAAQAYAAQEIGTDPQRLMQMLEEWFDVSMWLDPEMSQVHARRL